MCVWRRLGSLFSQDKSRAGSSHWYLLGSNAHSRSNNCRGLVPRGALYCVTRVLANPAPSACLWPGAHHIKPWCATGFPGIITLREVCRSGSQDQRLLCVAPYHVVRRARSRRFFYPKRSMPTYSSTQFVGSLRLAHSLIRAPIARHTWAHRRFNRRWRVRLLVAGPTRPCKRQCGCPVSVETWLILPVVIRLSQRLSHACLSISIIQ